MTKVAQLLGVTTPETIPTCREWRRSLVSTGVRSTAVTSVRQRRTLSTDDSVQEVP